VCQLPPRPRLLCLQTLPGCSSQEMGPGRLKQQWDALSCCQAVANRGVLLPGGGVDGMACRMSGTAHPGWYCGLMCKEAQ
jgi:hypothetical protein